MPYRQLSQAVDLYVEERARLSSQVEPAMNLEGDFPLKIYDRRYSCSRRLDHEGPWGECTPARDMNFEKRRWDRTFVKCFLHLMANGWLDHGVDDYEF
jgi:hypothetical protein